MGSLFLIGVVPVESSGDFVVISVLSKIYYTHTTLASFMQTNRN